MSLMETFQMALKNIWGSKMRTFLTMLGIIIGVCAVIVIVGLGNGMQGYIEDSFADMGTDSLTVMILGRGSSRSVSEELCRVIRPYAKGPRKAGGLLHMGGLSSFLPARSLRRTPE